MTFEQQTLAWVLVEIVFRGLELGAFSGLDPGAVELKENGLEKISDRMAVVDHAIRIAIGEAARARIRGAHVRGIARIEAARTALLPKYSRARIRALRFLRAAGNADQGAD